MKRCNECERRRPNTFSASRQGGGSYRRAPRWYSSTICTECAVKLIETRTLGHDTNNRWSLNTLTYRLQPRKAS